MLKDFELKRPLYRHLIDSHLLLQEWIKSDIMNINLISFLYKIRAIYFFYNY
jgi:hypothetical protein